MSKPSIQLSLPISGREEEARQDAAAMQEVLEAAGYRVYNPFELCADIPFTTELEHWWKCIDRCCDNIVSVNPDAIVFCSWHSRGMRIEHEAALRAGFSRYHFVSPQTPGAICIQLQRGDSRIQRKKSLSQSRLDELVEVLKPFDDDICSKRRPEARKRAVGDSE